MFCSHCVHELLARVSHTHHFAFARRQLQVSINGEGVRGGLCPPPSRSLALPLSAPPALGLPPPFSNFPLEKEKDKFKQSLFFGPSPLPLQKESLQKPSTMLSCGEVAPASPPHPPVPHSPPFQLSSPAPPSLVSSHCPPAPCPSCLGVPSDGGGAQRHPVSRPPPPNFPPPALLGVGGARVCSTAWLSGFGSRFGVGFRVMVWGQGHRLRVKVRVRVKGRVSLGLDLG